MIPEDLLKPEATAGAAEATIATNLLGPIRLTAELLPLLRQQAHSTVMMVSSGLAFIPLAMTPTYCATKAAIHSSGVWIVPHPNVLFRNQIDKFSERAFNRLASG